MPPTRCRFPALAAALLLYLTAGCAPDGDAPGDARAAGDADRGTPATLVVFTAASLTNAFASIAEEFEEAHSGVEIAFNLAGSQQLAQQLRLGAPADVFASANQVQMQAAIDAGRIDVEASLPFAKNRLVVVVPGSNPAGLAELQDLARPGLKVVLAADAVPVGRYSRLFLKTASLDEDFGAAYGRQVLSNVVSFEQNVRAVLTKVELGEADAGIVYASDLVGARAEGVRRIDIPGALNTVAVYPIAPVSDSAHPDLARAFIAFVRSPEGQAILLRHGFAPPDSL